MSTDIDQTRRDEYARRCIFDVLVEECGADERGLDDFLTHWPSCVEYRFGGSLGFGGKVWWNRGRVYVSCYSEDRTPERNAAIEKANARLAVFNSNRADR